MGIFDTFFKSRDKPENRTSGSAYSFFFGSSTAGKRVNERSAMQMTAVYSCVRILSEAVASLPLHLYEMKDGGSKEKAINHSLYFLLHDEPNPEMTSFIFRETLMTHLLLYGNAYCQIIRNGKGEVIALYPLMPNRGISGFTSKGNVGGPGMNQKIHASGRKDSGLVARKNKRQLKDHIDTIAYGIFCPSPFIHQCDFPTLGKIPAHRRNGVIRLGLFQRRFNVVSVAVMKRIVFCCNA